MPGIVGVLPCGRRSWGGPGAWAWGWWGVLGPSPLSPVRQSGQPAPASTLRGPGVEYAYSSGVPVPQGGVEYVYSRTVPWCRYCSVPYRPLRAGKSKFGEREARGLGPKRAAENLIKALDQSYQE